ncbi:MAG TPA: hypothetical protein VF170_05640, partial [Planctomycetaceae bacterium]
MTAARRPRRWHSAGPEGRRRGAPTTILDPRPSSLARPVRRQSAIPYRTMHQSAFTPSFQPIF